MPTPTKRQLLDWARDYVALWNAGNREGWVRNWRKLAPGGFRMLDPVGTPEKFGFDHCCGDSFELFQKNVKFKIHEGSLMVCGNEVAWLLENHITADGSTTIHYSIETYRFEPDGSCVIRTYYRVPTQREGELGAIFDTYLPEQ